MRLSIFALVQARGKALKFCQKHAPRIAKTLVWVALILGSATIVIPPGQTAQAANPNLISFQGKVVNADGTNVADGTYPFTFKLYSASSGGSALWTETYSGANNITVTSGVFQVELGTLTTLPDFGANPTLYLGITFNNDAAGEMTPRIHLDSVPYALNSNELGGISSSGFVQLSPASAQTGNININGSVTATTLQSASSAPLTITGNAASTWSTSAGNLTIQAASTSTLSLDTAGAGTVTVGTNASTVTLGAGSGTDTINIGNSTGSDTVNIAANTGSDIVNVGSAANPVTALNAYGNTLLQTPTNSATALVVQNAAGAQTSDTLFDLSTVANAGNIVTNGSFEVDETGWSVKSTNGSTVTMSQATGVGAPFGNAAMQITTSSAINPITALDGVEFTYPNTTLTNGQTYSMSFYAKIPSGSFSTLSFGRSDTGASPGTACNSASVASATDWLRFSCTFVAGAQSGTPYLFIGQNDTTARTWYIDGVSFEHQSTATYYKEGTLQVQGLALGNTVLIQPTVNTNATLEVAAVNGTNGLLVNTDGSAISTAFAATFNSTTTANVTSNAALEVRNATSLAPLVRADTTIVNNDTNGSFENNTGIATSYSTNHAGVTLTVDSTANNAYSGNSTGKLVVTSSAVANSGLKYNLTTATLASATTYTLSFYAKLPSGSSAFTTIDAGRADNGATETTCNLSSTTVTTYWQRYVCTFTTGTTSGTPYFFIGQSDAGVAHTYFLDGIQIEAGSSASNYREGKVQLTGDIISPTIFHPASDSTQAFQIQNASGADLFNVASAVTANLTTNGDFEGAGTAGWAIKGNASDAINQTTTQAWQGSSSLQVATTTSANDGAQYPYTFTPSTQYTLSLYAKVATGSITDVNIGRQDVSGTDVDCLTGQTLTTSWTRFNCSFTTGGTITSSNFYIKKTGGSAETFFIDGVQLQAGGNVTPFDAGGALQLGGLISSPVAFQNATDSTTAFQIQNAAGTSNLFVADTLDDQINIGGNLAVTGAAAGNGTATSIATGAASNVGTTIQGASAQKANLLQLEDSTGANLQVFDASGDHEQSGYLDTPYGGIGSYGNLLVQSEAFDNASWTKTSVTAPTPNTVLSPDGNTSAESLADSGSGGSVSQVSATAPTNANYTFSVWLKTSSGTQAVDLRVDGATTGTGTKATVTATTTWQRFSVTQNPNGFTGNIKALIFPGGTGGTGTVSAWGAQLVLGSTSQVYASTASAPVAASSGIVSDDTALFSPAGDSTTALQIQNAAGTDYITGDSTNTQLVLGKASSLSGKLAVATAGGGTITIVPTSTASNFTLTLPAETGTLCSTGSICTGYAASSGSGSYIQNSTSPQTANFNITGSGTVGSLLAGSTTIVPATDSLSVPQLAVETSAGNYVLTVADSSSLSQVGIGLGGTTVPSLTGSGLQIQGALQLSGGVGGSNHNIDTYVTPLGSNVGTKINIPSYDPGAFGQVIALGVPSGAASTARVISVFDDRGSAHQPSIGVFSPNENNIVGFSWDGSNTTAQVETTAGGINVDSGDSSTVGLGTSTATGKTIQIGPNATNTNTTTYQIGANSAGTQALAIGSTGTGVNANAGTTVSIQGGTSAGAISIGTSASVNQLLIGSTFGASSMTLQAGTGNLQLTTQGTGTLGIGNNAVAQNINIGNATGGTNVSVDCGTGACNFGTTATAHATTVGSTNTTSATTVQSGSGGISLNGNITASGTYNTNTFTGNALTFGTAGASTIQSTAGNLALDAAGTNTVSVDTTGAGTVSIASNATTLNLATTGTATAVGIGNTTASTTTLIQGGTGGSAVSLQAGSGGTILIGTTNANTTTIGATGSAVIASTVNLATSTGAAQTVNAGSSNASSAINLTAGHTTENLTSTGVAIKTNTANSTSAFQIQNAGGTDILNYNTNLGVLSSTPFGATYVGGADASGTANGGSGSNTVNNTFVSGHYEYVVTEGDGTDTCSTSLATGCELQVYDITNPSDPIYIGGADSSGATNSGNGSVGMFSIYVSGHYAYVGTDGNAGTCSATVATGCETQVYDVSSPATPTYVGGADISGITDGGSSNNFINGTSVSGHYLYEVTDGNATACSQNAGSAIGCELQVYDITNPTRPTYIGGADVSGATNSGTGSLTVNTISVSGHYVYIGTAGSTGTCSASVATGCEMQIYDVSNPATPTYVGGADSSGTTNGGSVGQVVNSIYVSGNYAYVAKAASVTICSSTPGAQGCELQVYNITNPATPTYVGGADSSGFTNSGTGGNNANTVFVSGHYLYLGFVGYNTTACSQGVGAAQGCELQVYDITTPGIPTYLGGIDTSGSTNSGTSADDVRALFVSGRYAYVAKEGNSTTACSQTPGSAIGCELQSYDLGGVDAVSVAANSLESGTLQVNNSASVSNQLNVGGGLVVGGSADVQGDLGVGGTTLLKDKTNSTSAFQVQNSGGANVVSADTTGANQNNLITSITSGGSPSFEGGSTTGWAGSGGCTLTSVTVATASPSGTTPFNGNNMGQCANTATVGAEFKYATGTTGLPVNGTYTLDFDAKASATPGTVLNFGYVQNGGGEDAAGLSLTSQNLLSNGWTHYSLTFKTGATNGAGDYIYIKQNDATARSIWLDAVTLQTDANADNNYREGKVQIGGTVSSTLTLQNATNSTSAFQVQDAAGANVFTVNTTDTNLLPNPGAEVSAAGWSGKGSGTIIRDTSQQKVGFASFKIVTTAANNDGAQYTGLNLPVGTYSIGLSAKLSSGAFAANGLQAGITNTGGDNACTLAPAVSATVPTTTGWTQFTCTVTIASTAGTAFFIRDNDTAVHTFWVDGIELDSGSTLTPYGIGVLSVNGIVNTPLTLQNESDSTTALTLQSVAGNIDLAVDTLNSAVSLGATGSAAFASTINIANTTGSAIQNVNIGSTSSTSATLIQGGSGSAITLTPATGGAIVIGNTGGTGQITLGSSSSSQTTVIGGGGGLSTVQIAGGTGANVIQIGNNQTGGAITIGNAQTGGTINIGGGSAVRTGNITIGSTGATSGVLKLIGGTGTGALGGTTSGVDVSVGTAGTINIGSAGGAGTGTITVGQSTATQNVAIASGITASGNTKSVNIGTGQNASTGITTINIGQSNTGTGINTVTIKAGGSGRSQGPSVTLGNVATQSNAVCSSLANGTAPTAGTAYELEDCNVAPAVDYAEMYPTDGSSTYGDIMMLGSQSVQEYDTDGQGNILYNSPKRTVTKLVPANQAYDQNVIGVISNNYDDFTSTGLGLVDPSDNPMPIALNGRIPVNISPSSAPIAVGDYITTSSDPGKGMKATQAGEVIGKALAAWDPSSGQTQIMVFVEQGYYAGPSEGQSLQSVGDLTASGTITTAGLQVNGTASAQNLTVNGMATLQSANVVGTASVAQLLATDATIQNLNVTGTATINNLSVTGTTTLASLNVAGSATIGDLSVQNSITTATLKVSGSAEVGQLQVDDQINLGSATEDPTQESPHPITKRFKASKPIPAGSLVIADTTAGYATTTTTAGDTRVVGIAVTAAANPGDVIEVAIGGTAKVLVNGTPAIGQLLHADSKEGDASVVAKPAPGEVVGKVLSTVDQNGEVMAIVTLE